MQVFISNQVCKFYMTSSYIYFILKEKSYIIQFISKLNQFESLNMSMLPQIENSTHKLYVGNSKKEINFHNVFSWNTIKCDLCEHTASKSTVLKRLLTIRHKNKCGLKKKKIHFEFMLNMWYNYHFQNCTKNKVKL